MVGEDAGGEIRVSDLERDAAVARLRDRAADGTLTFEELTGRVERALTARTRAELAQLEADLPRTGSPSSPSARAKGARRWFVGILGEATAKGRWRCADRLGAFSFMGGCELDLRRAVIDSSEVTITAVAFLGSIRVYVPEGVEVELTGVPIMGGKSLDLADVPPVPGAPRIVVRGFTFLGGVDVRSHPAS